MDQDSQPGYASEQELADLREEVRRLRQEQQKQMEHDGDGSGKAGHDEHQDEPQDAKNDGDDPRAQREKQEKRRRRRPWIIGGAIVLLLAGVLWWLHARQFENTDDAIVDGHTSGVAARINGTVTAVYVEENQSAQAGQVLVDLDPRDYQVALEQAHAQLLQAQKQTLAEQPNVPLTRATNVADIAVAQSEVARAQAGVAAAERAYAAAQDRQRESEANRAKAAADVERYRPLAAKDEVPQEQFDQVVANAKALDATVAANRESAAAALKQVDQARQQLVEARQRSAATSQNAPRQVAIREANLASRQAALATAQAQLDQAQLNLSYCKIMAPFGGIVAKRLAEVGQRVSPGQQLVLLTQIDDLWVTANFRETQLRLMHPGQSVTIHVDAIGKDFDGYVESMPAASGAVTSLLPPENATGNFVKVVQRLPVRIRFKKDQDGVNALRPGMSVEPKVRVR